MREILFRGKREDNGEWVFGMPWIFKDHACVCPWHEGMCKYDSGYYPVHVIPETVGQYTGLIDKNGNKIFEGDIVESQYTQLEYLVCFGPYTYTDEYEDDQDACGWYNQDINGCITALGCPERWATVIGNIHDRPELIGGKNDGE